MKKIISTFIITFALLSVTYAWDNSEINCNKLNWKIINNSCVLWNISINKKSFDDKYNNYILWIKIHYASEYKYSSQNLWKNYLAFLESDIKDLINFKSYINDKNIISKIDEDIEIQKWIYKNLYYKEKIWEKNANLIEKSLLNYEEKITDENKLKDFYNISIKKLQTKISTLENQMKTTKYTSNWYKNALLKLNSYKYLLILIEWRK